MHGAYPRLLAVARSLFAQNFSKRSCRQIVVSLTSPRVAAAGQQSCVQRAGVNILRKTLKMRVACTSPCRECCSHSSDHGLRSSSRWGHIDAAADGPQTSPAVRPPVDHHCGVFCRVSGATGVCRSSPRWCAVTTDAGCGQVWRKHRSKLAWGREGLREKHV